MKIDIKDTIAEEIDKKENSSGFIVNNINFSNKKNFVLKIDDFSKLIKSTPISIENLEKKYHKKPKLYCYDKYSNVNLYRFILFLNEVFYPDDFVMEKVKFIEKEDIDSFLNGLTNSSFDISLSNSFNFKEIL